MTTAHALPHPARAGQWRGLLLDAGLLASAVYVVADATCSLVYPGYSVANQVISELSAVGAPTAELWGAFMIPFGVLFTAFAVGVLLESRENASLRQTGWLMVAFVLSSPLWSFAPMHQRGDPFTSSDAGHIALGVLSVSLMVATVATGAQALGKGFRVYSWCTLAIVLTTGAATFYYVGPMMLGQSSPMVGVLERVSIHGFWIWLAVLSLALRHARRADFAGGSPLSIAAIYSLS